MTRPQLNLVFHYSEGRTPSIRGLAANRHGGKQVLWAFVVSQLATKDKDVLRFSLAITMSV